MKIFKILSFLAAIVLAAYVLGAVTGCVTKPGPGPSTNTVSTVDPVKLQQAKSAITPVVSGVIRRAILNSPQHAADIGNYARAVGSVFCNMLANKNFTPTYLIDAANAATLRYQWAASPDLIDAKNAVLALYQIFYADKLTVELPDNQWLVAVCGLFCDSVDQALKDAGQPGVK